MHGRLAVLEQDHAIGGRLAAVSGADAVAHQRHLMVGARDRAAGKAAPVYEDRAVHMPEEDVPDVAGAGEHLGEGFCLGQLDPVEMRNADVTGRVVHEQPDRPTAGRIQLPVQPVEPRRAKLAGRGLAAVPGIEEQEQATTGLVGVLGEAVLVARRVREGGTVPGAVVMVSKHQEAGQRVSRQAFAQPVIGGGVTVIGQVTGEDAEFGVAVPACDVVKAPVEPLGRIAAPQLPAGSDKVRVGELDTRKNSMI